MRAAVRRGQAAGSGFRGCETMRVYIAAFCRRQAIRSPMGRSAPFRFAGDEVFLRLDRVGTTVDLLGAAGAGKGRAADLREGLPGHAVAVGAAIARTALAAAAPTRRQGGIALRRRLQGLTRRIRVVGAAMRGRRDAASIFQLAPRHASTRRIPPTRCACSAGGEPGREGDEDREGADRDGRGHPPGQSRQLRVGASEGSFASHSSAI